MEAGGGKATADSSLTTPEPTPKGKSALWGPRPGTFGAPFTQNDSCVEVRTLRVVPPLCQRRGIQVGAGARRLTSRFAFGGGFAIGSKWDVPRNPRQRGLRHCRCRKCCPANGPRRARRQMLDWVSGAEYLVPSIWSFCYAEFSRPRSHGPTRQYAESGSGLGGDWRVQCPGDRCCCE